MTVLDAAAAERGKLRRVLGRMDTVFFPDLGHGGGRHHRHRLAGREPGHRVVRAGRHLPALAGDPDAALPAGFASQRGQFDSSSSRPSRPSSRRSRCITSPPAAAAGPGRGEDDVFESCIMRLIDVARPDDHANHPVR
jgi:hypothetical protein